MRKNATGMWSAANAGLLVALALGLALFTGDASAATKTTRAPHRVTFDHLKTGFPLTGQHAQEACETCHRGGVFAGTPRQCTNCHVQGSRLASSAKPTNHVPTMDRCDLCHNSTTTWGNATLHSHVAVAPGSCATCHNGSFVSSGAATKPTANHPTTSASCDQCHNTVSWSTTRYNHASVAPGSCATCHNGSQASGKGSGHIPTSLSCDTCHTTSSPFTVSTFRHTAAQGVTPGGCTTCHNGSFASQRAVGKPANHISTSAACDTCHTTNAWIPTSFNHTGIAAGSCATCHNGSQASGKGSGHIPTSLSCDTCHTTSSPFTTSSFSHSAAQGVTPGSCATCHNGSYVSQNALGKPGNHISTSAACDTCHSGYTTWTLTSFNHVGVSAGTCSNCHNGSSATGKGNNHIPTSLSCDRCHGTGTFTTSTFSHSAAQGVAPGGCATCHNGAYVNQNALGKPANHIATSASCDQCHSGYTSWATATFSHTGVAAGSCATCHNGSQASGKGNNHVPTSLSCDRCHGTSTFTTSTFSHSSTQGVTVGGCSACHSGAYVSEGAVGKPSGHVATSASCDQCHRTTAWVPATFSHTGIAAGTCTTCHNGSQATGKGSGHIPTSLSCDRCHGTTTFTTSTFSHTATQGVTPGGCATCHNGSYTAAGATGKPANHVSTSASCDQCHTTASWATAGFNHSGVTAGSCATCHNGTQAPGKGSNHIPTSLSCDRCHGTSTFSTSTFSHTSAQGVVARQCVTCHNGSYTSQNAQGMPGGHIPTTVTSALACDQCHSGYTSWSLNRLNHSNAGATIGSGTCLICHNGSYTSQGARGKPNDSRHNRTTSSCDASGCHRSTSSWD